ncbi:hypothetical protein ACUUL3_09755 [Thiovibrio sp. JS02]
MKIQYRIDPETKFITQEFHGEILLRDMLGFLETLFADPAYQPHYDGIADLRGAMLNLNYEEVKELVAFQSGHPRCSCGAWAFLAEKPLNFGVMRMFLSVGDGLGMDLNIFETEREVRYWQQKRVAAKKQNKAS